MKDYSNYHINRNDKIKHDGELLFEYALNGYESEDVTINNVATKAIIHTKYSDTESRYILGRVNEIERGYIVNWNSQNWLINTLPENNHIYKKAEMKLCNSTLTLKGEPTKTITGTDYRGAPIYEYVDGAPTLIPCIAENKLYISDNNQAINLPDNQIKVTIPYTVHNEIAINKVFPMYGNEYKIIGIDKTQSIDAVGLMVITGQFESEVSV